MKNTGLLLIIFLLFSFSSADKRTTEKDLESDEISDSLLGNQTDDKETQNVDNTTLNENNPKDITEDFCNKWDISSSFDSSYYGAFGENYQRIDLIIDSIIKTDDTKNYKLYGSTILKGKQVSYIGTLTITKVEQHDTDLYGMESGSLQTIITADYELIEDKKIDGSGIFRGDFTVTIHENKDGTLDYDTFDWMQDGYSNYIFNGTWLSPKNNAYQTYFADGKLEIGDLNVGAGEFVPNEKYIKNGWQDYMDRYFPNDVE